MQLISKLCDMIEDELDDAEKYARCALKHKETHPTLATVFNRLSIEELGHMNSLHEQVVSLINEYKKEHGDPPERMQGVYDYLHQKFMDRANEVKILQGLFKG